MLNTSIICFLASYGCAFALELCHLKWRNALLRISSLMIAALGLIAQFFYLLNRSSQSDLPPLLSSGHDWLLVLVLIIVVVYLFVSLADSELSIGLVIWPIVLSLVIAAQFVTKMPGLSPNYLRGWKMLHASMLALGTAGIVLGLILSLTYLWQHRRLKHLQSASGTVKLPNLELVQRLNRLSILGSVPLLTIGVVTGFGLSMIPVDGPAQMAWTDPVVIGGGITWLLMGVLFVWLLSQKRSPGKQVALLTAWSCGFLIVMLVGLRLFVGGVGSHGIHGTPESQAVLRQ